ncbi:JAB N-terminal domain-containing protein [Nonomuraea africana]|uniref:Proteasome lid subunit RPN8/RPN11 n=1 Tax=Nonomuraea africana TaxID=46171 RepID=A0ABR9KFE1_9ACTN|nr:JAB N-terminal domain-containing protein [Nonomuraea africana]MBE1560736.1 proteasome lid subunit RPN8/RPN11 [Nonomuraea africana]
MAVEIELFKGEQETYHARLALAPVLREALKELAGVAADDTRLFMQLHRERDPHPIVGPPRLVNLGEEVGFLTLTAVRRGETVYEGRHSVNELVGSVLTGVVTRLDPAETYWSFRIRAGLFDIDTGRPTPQVEGAVQVDLQRRRRLPFTVTKVEPAEAELVDPAKLGLDPAALGPVNVLLPAEVHELLMGGLRLSERLEEGGFLIGRVSRARPDAYLVEVTHITPAHRSGAGAIHFTFTGDSFVAVNQMIADRGLGEELVGWYHTHLRGVDVGLGLSATDVDLHRATFLRPWQVAALLNLSRNGRMLRFYGRAGDGERVEQCSQWVADERGRYRGTSPDVGAE